MSISIQEIVVLLFLMVAMCICCYKIGVYEGWKTGWKDHKEVWENLKNEVSEVEK